MKKFISLLLVLVMVLTIAPELPELNMKANAAETQDESSTEGSNDVFIEAESYDSMSGVALRKSTDQNSGIISSVDAGDYMIYTVEILTSGTYRFDVRAARSDAGTSVLSLMENDSVIASCSINQTGSWTTFSEFEGTEVYLTAGTHTLKVYAEGGRYNLNWYTLTYVVGAVVAEGNIFIEAESYDSMSGVTIRETTEQNSDVISSVDAGDYMIYTVEVPVSGTYRFDVRAARSDAGTSILSLMENDNVIASCNIGQTGSWTVFSEFEGTESYLTAGSYTFKVYAEGGRYNLNWYTLVYVSGAEIAEGDVLIEAEEYDSMSGIEVKGILEQGSDVIGSVDAGDYMIYTVDVPASSIYRFDVRAARSDSSVSTLILMENDSAIASCDIEQTGSWSEYSEFKGTEFYLTAGTHTFKVYAKGGRYNLNWYKLVKIENAVADGTIRVEAESYDSMSGVELRGTLEQGSDVISSVDAGDYMIYTVDIAKEGAYKFRVRASRSEAKTSVLSLMENDSVIATCDIEQTGSWTTFNDFDGTEFYLTAGSHTLKIYADGGRYNLNWYDFIYIEKETSTDGVILIEAEDYDSMLGVEVKGILEQGSDVVGSVNMGDYMIYTVEVPVSGIYRFDVRAARYEAGVSNLYLMENDSVIASCGIGCTDSWSIYDVFEGTEVYIKAGTHTFKTYAVWGRYNLNWYKLVYIEEGEAPEETEEPEVPLIDAFETEYDIHIEAEDYDSMSGVTLKGVYDQGTDVLTSVDTGDYMVYTVNVTKSGTYRFDVRVAKNNTGSRILSLRENDEVIANCYINNTGSWTTFKTTKGSEFYLTEGTHTLTVYADAGNYNLNWFRLVYTSLDETE